MRGWLQDMTHCLYHCYRWLTTRTLHVGGSTRGLDFLPGLQGTPPAHASNGLAYEGVAPESPTGVLGGLRASVRKRHDKWLRA